MEKSYYEDYAVLETSHWWFKARMRILSMLVKTKMPGLRKEGLRILNAGVASGNTTRMLEAFGTVTSLEYDGDCCDYLRNVAHIDVVQGSLTELPFANESFDLVCAFDVVEHIEEDQLAMKEVYRVLRKGGYAFMTVPAFRFLWSDHDLINHHFRRYNGKQFKKLFQNQNLRVNHMSYFNFFLFPLILLARMAGKLTSSSHRQSEAKSDFEFFRDKKFLNKLFYKIFILEKFFLDKMTFPFGVSLMAIAVKE